MQLLAVCWGSASHLDKEGRDFSLKVLASLFGKRLQNLIQSFAVASFIHAELATSVVFLLLKGLAQEMRVWVLGFRPHGFLRDSHREDQSCDGYQFIFESHSLSPYFISQAQS